MGRLEDWGRWRYRLEMPKGSIAKETGMPGNREKP